MRDQNLARLVEHLPDGELLAAPQDAAVGLSLLRPGSPMYGPARACSMPNLPTVTTPGSRPSTGLLPPGATPAPDTSTPAGPSAHRHPGGSRRWGRMTADPRGASQNASPPGAAPRLPREKGTS